MIGIGPSIDELRLIIVFSMCRMMEELPLHLSILLTHSCIRGLLYHLQVLMQHPVLLPKLLVLCFQMSIVFTYDGWVTWWAWGPSGRSVSGFVSGWAGWSWGTGYCFAEKAAREGFLFWCVGGDGFGLLPGYHQIGPPVLFHNLHSWRFRIRRSFHAKYNKYI